MGTPKPGQLWRLRHGFRRLGTDARCLGSAVVRVCHVHHTRDPAWCYAVVDVVEPPNGAPDCFEGRKGVSVLLIYFLERLKRDR